MLFNKTHYMENKVIAFYNHPTRGKLEVYSKWKSIFGFQEKWVVRTNIGTFNGVNDEDLILPEKLPDGIDL